MITIQQAKRSLAKWRKKLLVPLNWQIDLLVLPEEDMDDCIGRCRWGYLPNAEYRISVRDSLSFEAMDWTIAHELLEALMANYAHFVECNVFDRVLGNKGLLRYLVQEHGDIRDTIIEHFLTIITGKSKPSRLY